MNKVGQVLIWDIPTRLFHWLLAGGFIVTAVLAFVFDEHSLFFPYHAILGLIIVLMVVLRVTWGFVGTHHARFASFFFSPRKVFDYMKGVLSGSGLRYAGHNPGSAYAIFAMLTTLMGLAITGIMLGLGNELVEDVHEFLSYMMIVIAATHVMGVLLHTIRYKENITASMIHGKKEVETNAEISSSHPVIAVIFLVLTGAWAWGLFANYNAATLSTRLPLFGVQLQLGEIETEDEFDQFEQYEHEDDDEHEEDDG